MKVIQARVRGLGTTIESLWFKMSPRLTLCHFPDDIGRASFLRTLETVNPSYSCLSTKPFADFPLKIELQGYPRRIRLDKRTVALAIFNSTPELVKELAEISPQLYDTDRIEVGRRLDYTRWINFVEMASSTRWSEISSDMLQLMHDAERIAPDGTEPIAALIKSLKASDRIKDGLAGNITNWLISLPNSIGESARQRKENMLTSVRRAEHFHRARTLVEQRLPLFMVLKTSPISQDPYPSPLFSLIDRITDRCKDLSRKSEHEPRNFLAQLNRHLSTMRFSGMILRIEATGAGFALSSTPALETRHATPRSAFKYLQAAALLTIAYSRVVCRTEPVLLFDSPERSLPAALHPDLADFILRIAEFCQCLYGYTSVDIFPPDQDIKRYTATELTMGKCQSHDLT